MLCMDFSAPTFSVGNHKILWDNDTVYNLSQITGGLTVVIVMSKSVDGLYY